MAKPEQAKFKASEITIKDNGSRYIVKINGFRSGRPSKRIVLKTNALKFDVLSLTHTQKNKLIQHTIDRINYLPTKNETRIHTSGLLYPGQYELELSIEKSTQAAEIIRNLAPYFN